MTPDVNVLVAAARPDHPHHAVARAWFEEAIAAARAGRPLALLPMVVAGFVRLVTNGRIFPVPAAADEAFAHVDGLLALPGVRMGATSDEWPLFRRLCIEHRLAANGVPDAWLAAAVIHASEHLVTFDRGFRKLMPRSQLTVLAPA